MHRQLSNPSDEVGLPKEVEDPRRGDSEEEFEEMGTGWVSKEEFEVVCSGGRRGSGIDWKRKKGEKGERRKKG